MTIGVLLVTSETIMPPEQITLEIQDLTDQGDGLGRWEGLAVFVPQTVPGETVRVEVTERAKRFARARLLEVQTPAPERTTPPCPVAETCGGCSWQHLRYEAQLQAKQKQVYAALQRLGGFHDPKVAPILASEPLHYRNKVAFPVVPGPDRKQLRIGYFQPGSHDLVEFGSCPAQDERIDQAYRFLLQELPQLGWSAWSRDTDEGLLRHVLLRVGRRTGETLLTLVTRHPVFGDIKATAARWLEQSPDLRGVCLNLNPHPDQRILGKQTELLAGTDEIEEVFGGMRFGVGPETFFQVHTEQAERILELLLEQWSSSGDQILWDLYCGIGTFTLPLARHFRKVWGLEWERASVEQARRNASRNGIANVEFRQGAAEKSLRALPERPDFVFLDPPRQGCDPKVLQQLRKLGPAQIAYLSCNPATQSRDLKLLCDSGKYRVTLIQPADFFPQTPHVECLVLLVRS